MGSDSSQIRARLAPELSQVHPITAYSAQECTEITAHIFQSLRLDTTHRVPSYRRWLDRTGHRAAYRFHKRFLQHLQRQKGPGRWILKCPDHLFALEAIGEVYPDARFVFLHRDPTMVLASVARLTEVLRRPFTRQLDRHDLGRQVMQRVHVGAVLALRPDLRRGPELQLRYECVVLMRERLELQFAADDAGGIELAEMAVVARDRHRFALLRGAHRACAHQLGTLL